MPVLLTAAFNEVSNDKKQLRPLRPASNLASRGKRNAKLADAMTHRELFVFARDLRPFNRAFRYRSCYLADRWLGVTLIHQSATWYRNMLCPAARLPAVTAARSPASMGPYPLIFREHAKEKDAQNEDSPLWAKANRQRHCFKLNLSRFACKRRASSATSNMMRFSIGNRLTLSRSKKCKWNLQETVVIFGKYLEVSTNSFMILVTCREHCVRNVDLQKV